MTTAPLVLCRMLVVSMSLLRSIQAATGLAITITADADCVVALDDKFVSRLHKDHSGIITASPGKHKISAATIAGDYFEESVNVLSDPGPSISIAFEQIHRERVAMQKKVSDLRKLVNESQQEISRRKAIVAAVNFYADYWGKDLGISEGLNQTATDLDDTISKQAMQNAGNSNTAVQLATEGVMAIEWLQYRHLKAKAHLTGFVAAVASRHLEYLRTALNNPLEHPPDREELGYLAIVHTVKHHSATGTLVTVPDRIEYSDSLDHIRIPCDAIKGAHGDSELHLVYHDATTTKRILVVQAAQRLDRQMLLGDIYLACPNLLQ